MCIHSSGLKLDHFPKGKLTKLKIPKSEIKQLTNDPYDHFHGHPINPVPIIPSSQNISPTKISLKFSPEISRNQKATKLEGLKGRDSI